jgi:hypothetical protein
LFFFSSFFSNTSSVSSSLQPKNFKVGELEEQDKQLVTLLRENKKLNDQASRRSDIESSSIQVDTDMGSQSLSGFMHGGETKGRGGGDDSGGGFGGGGGFGDGGFGGGGGGFGTFGGGDGDGKIYIFLIKKLLFLFSPADAADASHSPLLLLLLLLLLRLTVLFPPLLLCQRPGGDIELSEKQKQGMLEIDANNEEIDNLLDEASEGIAILGQLALAMGEELDLQADMLEDVGKNIDKAEDAVSKVNKDLKEVLDDPSACCQNQIVNLILCAVVLGIAGIVFNIVTTNNQQ